MPCCAVPCCAVLTLPCCAVSFCAVLCHAYLMSHIYGNVWQGLFLKGSLVHGEHRFEFPVFMTREPDMRTFLLAYLGPPLLSYTINTLLVRPLWRHHRLKKVCPHQTLTAPHVRLTVHCNASEPHWTLCYPTPPHSTPPHPLVCVTSIMLTLITVGILMLVFVLYFFFCGAT